MKRNKRQRSYKTTTSTELDYMRVIKISAGVLIVFALVLIGSKLAMGEIKLNKSDENKETQIGYQEIIAGEAFNRKQDEYYVLFFSLSGSNYQYFVNAINMYKQYPDHAPIYVVDLDKKFNSEFIKKEGEDAPYPKNIDSLKVEDPTLLKISNSETVDVIVGKDDITEFFNK